MSMYSLRFIEILYQQESRIFEAYNSQIFTKVNFSQLFPNLQYLPVNSPQCRIVKNTFLLIIWLQTFIQCLVIMGISNGKA